MYTTIINKNNLFKESFIKRFNLVSTSNINNEEIFLEEETYNAYLELKSFLEKKNILIGIDEGYRTIKDQEDLYNEFIKEYGEEYTKKHVALPGSSEHHLGTSIDLNIKINNKYCTNNEELEKYDSIFRKIHKYLYKFGFILRYPKGKEHITNYPYEAWHIRYVGKVISKIIYDNNYTLEEYLNNFSGILLINKEKDMTSFDVIRNLSKIFGIKKIGHTGTLDPMAEGVLVVVIGKALKIAELLTSTYKEYEAGVLLGAETDTLDITGKIVKTKVYIDKGKLEEVINSYKKTYLQEVPKYSAVKINGKKLYEYARNNINIELPKKEVTIKEIELLSTDMNAFNFRCLVSKGCYIRSLIRDIGDKLNIPCTMKELRRTRLGDYTLDDAITTQDLKDEKLKILPLEKALKNLLIVDVDSYIENKINHGAILRNLYDKDLIAYRNQNNEIIAIYKVYEKDNTKVKPVKVFYGK